MTTGTDCSKGCGNLASRRGGTCTGCGIEEIANPLWRSIRRTVHNALSPDLPGTDANGIVWHSGSQAGPETLFVRCNDAPTDAAASALDRVEVAQSAGSGSAPLIKQASPQAPGWWTEATPEQKQAWKRMDAELARQPGYDRPYTHGPHVGTCPGTAGSGRGRGLTASTVHAGCCSRWDEAREAAIAGGLAEPSDEDRAVTAADVARWEAAQELRARTAGLAAAAGDREAAS
jgi:hypothetical protein